MHTESIQKTCLASNVATLGAPRGRDVPNTAVLASTKPGVRSQSENRRIKINYPGTGNNSQFTYDGLNRLVDIVEITGGTTSSTKQFVWNEDKLCESRDASGNVTAQYFKRGQTISGTPYFWSKDQIGSIRELSTSSGTLQSQYLYDSFGRRIIPTTGVNADFQYAELYSHGRSGLDLALHRAYSSSLGRWINRDPLEGPMSGLTNPRPRTDSNVYVYVRNRLTSDVDPSGLCSCDNAPGSPSTGPGSPCQGYGNEMFLNTSEVCVCQCTGDSAAAQAIRGCLWCEHQLGADANLAHYECIGLNPGRAAPELPRIAACGALCGFGPPAY